MRIALLDHPGHPFQVQLSRALAGRGHQVLHLHAETFSSPKGALARRSDDPPTFAVEGLRHAGGFSKYDFVRRVPQELRFGRQCARRLDRFAPDVLVLSNTPPFTQEYLSRHARRAGWPTVIWLQDIYSVAVERMELPVPGPVRSAIVRSLRAIDRASVRRSAAVVSITEGFSGVLQEWGIPDERVTVIPNWATIEDLPVGRKDNAWAREHGLQDRCNFVYTGTLGLKHDPDLLVDLGLHFADDPDVRVIVASEGQGADHVRARVAELDLTNVAVVGFQPYDRYADVLATADVLVAVLEKDAGAFSVPSKVLSYLCAGRPVLGSIPAENAASATVTDHGAGVTVEPGDRASFVDAAAMLRADEALRASMGASGRAHAERSFRIDAVTERFEAVFESVR